MKQKTIIFVATITIICVGISILSIEILFPANTLQNLIKNAKPIHFSRVWEQKRFQPIKLDSDLSVKLSEPVGFVYYKDYLYATDFGDMTIKRFKRNGKFLNNIGKGHGRGPGEFQTIMNFVIQDSTMWIVDPNRLLLSKFNVNGKYQTSVLLKYIPDRITTQGTDKLIMEVIEQPKLYAVYNKSGNFQHLFGILATDQQKNSLSFESTLLPYKNNGFISVPVYASLIYFFDSSDSVQKVVSTPDGISFPLTINESTKDRKAYQAPATKIENLNACEDNGILYLNTFIKKDKHIDMNNIQQQRSVIDRYDLETGQYLNSIKLPFVPLTIQVSGDTLYCLFVDTGKIKAYKMVNS